jgi:agmatinase
MNKSPKNEILEEKISNFNPNENGLYDHGIFGLPFNPDESKVVLVPVPWEATVSYGSGTENGPKAILDSSQQIDLYDPLSPNSWKEGISMMDIPASILYQSKQVKEKTESYLEKYKEGHVDDNLQNEIKEACLDLKKYIKETTSKLLKDDKIVGIVGGEHGVSLGFLETLSEKYNDFGILHIDAHLDLRNSYEGLEYSHASIFFNALKLKSISKLVSVGIRDFCEEEQNFINNDKRVILFTDYEIRKAIFKGSTWAKICNRMIKNLPKNVYISFDIDGLVPYLSPNTGTPVVGGFTVEELVFLFEELIDSGRKIIGFDLCEVGKEEWDGNVGARILYKLCLATLKSQKK